VPFFIKLVVISVSLFIILCNPISKFANDLMATKVRNEKLRFGFPLQPNHAITFDKYQLSCSQVRI